MNANRVAVAWVDSCTTEVRPMAPSSDVGILLSLFHGDDLTGGYPTPELVAAICEHLMPESDWQLIALVFGAPEEDKQLLANIFEDLTHRERVSLQYGFRLWKRREKAAA